MKIAFVYDAIYPWIKGGAEKRIYEIGIRLVKLGHEVHIFGIKWWDGKEIFEKDGIIYHGVCEKMELYIDNRRSISEAIIFSFYLFKKLIKEKFDIIDVTAFPYFSVFSVKLVSILKKTPFVVTWHEVWMDYWYEYLGLKGFFGKYIEFLVSHISKNLISVSQLTTESLKKLGIHEKNITLIPNGINYEKINKIQPSKEESDIIFVGRLIKEKNVNLLIESVNILKKSFMDIRCHIIGDGPEKKSLLKLTAKYRLQNNIKFLGFMEYEEVISRIKSSKVFVFPSCREGFGIVVIEAFAAGIPVITVKCEMNAAYLLIDKNTGFVVDKDAFEIANKVSLLISDTKLYNEMRVSCIIKAHKYDWNNIVIHAFDKYNKLIK